MATAVAQIGAERNGDAPATLLAPPDREHAIAGTG